VAQPLDEAIARRAGELRAASGVEIRVRGHAPALPTFAAVHAYRVACEAITNALRHAEPGRIDVSLHVRASTLLLTVADDGRGLAEPAGDGATGLESMRARAEMLGGHLRIHGERRAGTRVELEIPLRGGDGAQAAASPS
jgi:signal transduction histidine kinase